MSLSPKRCLKNDEELPRREGGEATPSEEMTRLARNTSEHLSFPYVFLLLGKKRAPFVSPPSPFFPNSPELLLQVLLCDSKADNSCKQRNKKEED